MLHSKMYHFSLFFLQHYLYRFYNIMARDLNDTVYENTQMPRPTIILQTFLLLVLTAAAFQSTYCFMQYAYYFLVNIKL